MKKFLSLFLVFSFTFAAQAETKIAVIDVQLIYVSHAKYPETQAAAKAFGQQKSAEIKKFDEQIEAISVQAKNDLDAARSLASSEKRRNEARERLQLADKTIYELRVERQRMIEQTQREMNVKRRDFFELVMNDCRKVMDELVKEKGYNLILDRSAYGTAYPIPMVMFADDTVDITGELVKRMGGNLEEGQKRLLQDAEELAALRAAAAEKKEEAK